MLFDLDPSKPPALVQYSRVMQIVIITYAPNNNITWVVRSIQRGKLGFQPWSESPHPLEI